MTHEKLKGSDDRAPAIPAEFTSLLDDMPAEQLAELIALADEHLDPAVRQDPEAMLAILCRVGRLSQQKQTTQQQLFELMARAADTQVGRFRRFVRLVLSGVFKKLQGGRYKVGAVAFYGGVEDIGRVGNENQYDAPYHESNATMVHEAQMHGDLRHAEGDAVSLDSIFYGYDNLTEPEKQQAHLAQLNHELALRSQDAQAIRKGEKAVDIQEMIDELDMMTSVWAQNAAAEPASVSATR